MTAFRISSVLLCALFSIVFFTGCGGGVSGKIKISSLQSPSTFALRKRGATSSVSSKMVASKTHFAYAAVDGVKLYLTKVQGEDANASAYLTTVDINQEIELSGDANQAVALSKDVSFNTGSYRGISLHFKNTWKVKAHCRTMKTGGANTGYLVYTTASGVSVKDCSSGGVDCTTLPDTYDYFEQDALSTYSGYVDADDYQQETHLNFTISGSDSPILSMLYDGTYNITCWDGQTTYDTNEAFGGFAGMTQATHTQYYGETTPSFASYYLPIFGYVTTDANEATPNARTFLASAAQPSNGSDLDMSQSTFTFKPLTVVTLVYNASGTAIAGSTRNYQGNGSSNPFDLDLEGFGTASSGSGIDFYGSGWYWSGPGGTPQFVRNKKIKNFSPAAVGTLFSTAYEDASGCGQTLTDFQGNNPSRGCMSTPSTVWWLEMSR